MQLGSFSQTQTGPLTLTLTSCSENTESFSSASHFSRRHRALLVEPPSLKRQEAFDKLNL